MHTPNHLSILSQCHWLANPCFSSPNIPEPLLPLRKGLTLHRLLLPPLPRGGESEPKDALRSPTYLDDAAPAGQAARLAVPGDRTRSRARGPRERHASRGEARYEHGDVVQAESPLGGLAGVGRERRERGVSLGGARPALPRHWGKENNTPGTRRRVRAPKKTPRAPAPTAARRVPSGPALTDERRVPSGPAPARSSGGVRGTRAPTPRRRRHGEARRPGLPAPPRPVSPPSGLGGGPRRLLRAPRPTATYPRPSPPELRAAPYRPRRPVQARGAGVEVVVATLLGLLSRAHSTASCQSPKGIPRGLRAHIPQAGRRAWGHGLGSAPCCQPLTQNPVPFQPALTELPQWSKPILHTEINSLCALDCETQRARLVVRIWGRDGMAGRR
eukprot:XP_017452378.1 PREDICTED: serine/arginine repetitive matrix protein 1-like [Rattus norvegicus]